jgi:2-polyprenyl-3-methyl-5-hydroxy-6-metoxy-1,4-benzoquinol methylase
MRSLYHINNFVVFSPKICAFMRMMPIISFKKINMHLVQYHPDLDFYSLAHKPSQQELNEYYAKKYYQEEMVYEKHYSENELCLFKQKIEQRHAAIKACRDIKNDCRFLDVGCGEGFALQYFFDLDFQVKGLDFSEFGIEQHHPDRLDTFVAGDIFHSLDKEIESGNQYDIVWLQNVLEHVLEPFDLLHKLKRLVAPSGCLVVTVPNDFSELQSCALEQGILKTPFWVAVPDHIHYFNVRSIQKIFEHTGWSMLDKLADFPIDWFLFNQAANYINNPAVGAAAHGARLMLENLMMQKNSTEQINAFYRSLANVGMGRNVTIIVSPS